MDGDYNEQEPDVKEVVRTQKLKEACDMCSASKIKCNKAKPICGRCEKLGCHCSYSPTRRMGRPHPPRPAPSQIIPKMTRDSTKRLATIRTKAEYVEPESEASSNEPHFSLQSQTRQKSTDTFREFTINFNDGENNDGKNSDIRDEYSPKESLYMGRKDAFEGTGLFDFGDQGNTTEVDGFFRQLKSNEAPRMLLSNAPSQSRRTSSSIDKLSAVSTNGEGSGSSNTCDEDCATLAMNTLQDLSVRSLKRVASGTSVNEMEMEMETIDAPMKTVSMAIKCISTILVCPCSQKTDVCLLSATVCTAILDKYGGIFRNCAPRDSARVLEELPKVASLVMQFNRRCCQDAKDYSGNLLPALGASLKSRLQSMTNEAIDCLARD